MYKKIIKKTPEPLNPIIITDINMRIVGVNQSWINMCKFSHEDAFGNTPKILQGLLTNFESARNFASILCNSNCCFASLINYKKDGSIFVNHLYGWYVGDLFLAETYAEDLLGETCTVGDIQNPPSPPPERKITNFIT